MQLEAKLNEIKKPIMVLGTSSGAGKSLTATAICRILKNLGEEPIPFKGQNMSNNAWVCLLYTSPSPRDRTRSRMPSSA